MDATGLTKHWQRVQEVLGSSLVSATDLGKSLFPGPWFPHLERIESWFHFLSMSLGN